MYVKTNYNSIKSVGDYLVDRAEEFNKKIDSMIAKLEELEAYWSGPDYDNYKEVYKTYLLNAKTSYIEMNALGNALDRVSFYYGEMDNKFGEKMRKFGEEYDKERIELQ